MFKLDREDIIKKVIRISINVILFLAGIISIFYPKDGTEITIIFIIIGICFILLSIENLFKISEKI
ncbi:MAG: hypothetical protein FXF49_01725 [Flexistipes sinusarabici]|uniref:Uncharacterized protein n=1 Tax=Flexistipes sinusarabici TaxID=2352 RepID=A0A5D0MSS0_FLESI|nr:hypothetical protein [Flexistipes sinusarabici]TYB34988.1 MAG: hypothetical protein FXF49_01725 [Flexistipes sinusarabici]